MNLESVTRIDAAALAELVPMTRAIEAIEELLLAGFNPETSAERVGLQVASGQLLLMPAETSEWVGLKGATVAPANPPIGLPRIQALYLLHDAATLSPVAILDGTALTNLRTPAVSAVAVRHLAPLDAARLVVFGAGPQAFGHVDALCAVRPIRSITVVSRSLERAARLVEHCHTAHGIGAIHGTPEAVASADIIACCTTARTPVFSGELMADHAVVVAVGSHEPSAREVDDIVMRHSTVVVEARSAALREAGDIIGAARSGALDPDQLIGLAEVVRGEPLPTRRRVFKSVGMGWEDLVVAAAAYEHACLASQVVLVNPSTAPPAPTLSPKWEKDRWESHP